MRYIVLTLALLAIVASSTPAAVNPTAEMPLAEFDPIIEMTTNEADPGNDTSVNEAQVATLPLQSDDLSNILTGSNTDSISHGVDTSVSVNQVGIGSTAGIKPLIGVNTFPNSGDLTLGYPSINYAPNFNSFTAKLKPTTEMPLAEAVPATGISVNEADPVTEMPLEEAFSAAGISGNEADLVTEMPLEEAFPATELSVNEADPVTEMPLEEAFSAAGISGNEVDLVTEMPFEEAFPATELSVNEADPVTEMPLEEAFPPTEISVNEADPVTEMPLDEAVPATEISVNEADPVTVLPLAEAFPATGISVNEAVTVTEMPLEEVVPATEMPLDETDLATEISVNEADLVTEMPLEEAFPPTEISVNEANGVSIRFQSDDRSNILTGSKKDSISPGVDTSGSVNLVGIGSTTGFKPYPYIGLNTFPNYGDLILGFPSFNYAPLIHYFNPGIFGLPFFSAAVLNRANTGILPLNSGVHPSIVGSRTEYSPSAVYSSQLPNIITPSQDINGFSPFNGVSQLNGVSSFNGVSPFNGLSSFNGVSPFNGLSSFNGFNGVNTLPNTGGILPGSQPFDNALLSPILNTGTIAPSVPLGNLDLHDTDNSQGQATIIHFKDPATNTQGDLTTKFVVNPDGSITKTSTTTTFSDNGSSVSSSSSTSSVTHS